LLLDIDEYSASHLGHFYVWEESTCIVLIG